MSVESKMSYTYWWVVFI